MGHLLLEHTVASGSDKTLEARRTPPHATIGAMTSPAHDSAFLRACRREPVPHTPVWFMRQAGRALPEYRALREGVAMLDSCARPDMVTEITLQPVRRFGGGAAVFFRGNVVPPKGVGGDPRLVAGG